MRAMGMNPTEAELLDLINEVKIVKLHLASVGAGWRGHRSADAGPPVPGGSGQTALGVKVMKIYKEWNVYLCSAAANAPNIPLYCPVNVNALTMWLQYDTDGSGMIEFPEFCNMMADKMNQVRPLSHRSEAAVAWGRYKRRCHRFIVKVLY